VRDSSGPDGTSLLKEDSLPLELLPGPASVLAFEGPSELASGSRGLLGQLAVTACDDWGNVVEDVSTEVSLVPAALAADGHAAKVSAAGGNRAKLKKGAQWHCLELGGVGWALVTDAPSSHGSNVTGALACAVMPLLRPDALPSQTCKPARCSAHMCHRWCHRTQQPA
jgi:hypothetical protein